MAAETFWERKENFMKEKSKGNMVLPIIIFMVLFFFPFLIPLVVMGGFTYALYKMVKVKSNTDNPQADSCHAHDDESFDHHEDDCINCGNPFDDSDDEDNDCMFCSGEDNYVSEAYNNTYKKDTSTNDEFDLQQTLNGFGKSVTAFAKNVKSEYESSSIKPKVDKASVWIKEELSVGEKDDEEEASAYFGTYDDAKEEAEGLKALLKAGVIEKDEYNERVRELKNRTEM